MLRLIPFELIKIWRKKSFALSVCVLLWLHIFLLWYTSLPDGETPELSAYKAIQAELSGMSEVQKGRYMEELKETIDGVCFVQDILAMQGFQNEMGDALAEQEMKNNPGVFEKYYEMYQSGGYLQFAATLEQEKAFIDEIYEEQKKAEGYGEYLASIQENKENLSGISIFGGEEQDTYSSRNLQKSAKDYSHLSAENIRFVPSKGITSAMQGIWIDLLLFLNVMLFVGNLITEEKEKKLLFITRSTKHGILHSIVSRLAALLMHCILLSSLFYAVSVIFFGYSTGWFEPGASLQSVAPYAGSSLNISILGYILLSVLTKAFLLFGLGAVLTAFCIVSGIAALPFLAGAAIMGGSALLYYSIPSGSMFAVFKYVNPFGLMKTENLYGGYLNFNMFGYPVSRLELSVLLILFICVMGTGAGVWLFCRMRNFEVRKLRMPFAVPFHPHTNIMRHEGYKILVSNRALLILLLFAALLAYDSLGHSYTPSVAEQYYGDIMAELEGEFTDKKESLLLSEKSRYEDAFQSIERAEEMQSAGQISKDAADDIKMQAEMTLTFYPAFQRVEEQYEHIRAKGGSFVYDTGYLELFGVFDDPFSVDFLILTIGMILTVSGAAAMEYQNGSLFLLCATKAGKRKIFARKLCICAISAAILTFVPFVCRLYRISTVYSMHSLGASVRNISRFRDFAVPLPIVMFILLFVLSQVLSVILVSFITTAFSMWRKNLAQTVFFSLLFLAVPLILYLLGFGFAKWFSLYPLYSMMMF
ncbi:MAG: hypothetical protein HFH14_02630 [Lachnospiraceae bacterium]|nr:hypothetical protein [Lachnospiraceae bacterium]